MLQPAPTAVQTLSVAGAVSGTPSTVSVTSSTVFVTVWPAWLTVSVTWPPTWLATGEATGGSWTLGRLGADAPLPPPPLDRLGADLPGLAAAGLVCEPPPPARNTATLREAGIDVDHPHFHAGAEPE